MYNKKFIQFVILGIFLSVITGLSVAKVTKDVAICYANDKWIIDPGIVWITNGLTVHIRNELAVLQYVSGDWRFKGLNYIVVNGNTDLYGVGVISGKFRFVVGDVTVADGEKYIKDEDIIGVWEGTWTAQNYYISPGPYYPSGGPLYIYSGRGTGQGSGAFQGMKVNFLLGYDEDNDEYVEFTQLVE
ncbi:MAG TPA: hypothetical protein PK360_00775 [bacterium]|mgnify:CR=1 FL=1|nr:hypothetical protein [bacterium]